MAVLRDGGLKPPRLVGVLEAVAQSLFGHVGHLLDLLKNDVG
jgi:hypothetical protein